MALFKVFRGKREDLAAQEMHDGYAYFCSDGTFHIDYADSDGNLQRKQINAKDAETLTGMSLEEIKNLINDTVNEKTSGLASEAYVDTGISTVQTTADEAKALAENAAPKEHEHPYLAMVEAQNNLPGGGWLSVAYGDGVFVATRRSSVNQAYYSTDGGVTWHGSKLSSTGSWVSVAYGNGIFVTILYGYNTAAYSTDGGITWKSATLPSSAYWKSVTYGNGIFVAVALNSDKAAYSTDGITWTESTLPSSDRWASVAFGNGTFVAITETVKTAHSFDGITWYESVVMPLGSWDLVAYGNDTFVAFDRHSAKAAYSTNGVTWTETTLPSSAYWKSVTYGNGIFVAVAGGDGNIATAVYSTDGINWTESSKFRNDNWCGVAYGNGKFIALGGGSGVVASTVDGNVWHLETIISASNTWRSIACSDDGIVMVSENVIVHSTDGLSWQVVQTYDSGKLASVTYGNGVFVACGNNVGFIRSIDGITWSRGSGSLSNCCSVAFGNGIFVAIAGGDTTSNKAAYSTDGVTWTETAITLATWQSVTYGNGIFVAVGAGTAAAYSNDGINWTKTIIPSSDTWVSVAYGNGKFVAVSSVSSKAAYSTDGITWTESTLPSSDRWASVAFGNGIFVAIAGGLYHSAAKAAYSTDGINWIESTLPVSARWCSVACSNGDFYAVANEFNQVAVSIDGGRTWTLSYKRPVIDGVVISLEDLGAAPLAHASAAKHTANEAKALAEEAQSTADEAKTAASAAQHTANEAKALAEEAANKELPEGGYGYEEDVPICDTITWDGTPSDTVVVVDPTQGFELHHISDLTPPMNDLFGGFVLVNLGSPALIELTESNLMAFNSEVYGIGISGTPVAGVSFADDITITYDGVDIHLPKKGIYFAKANGSALALGLYKEGYVFTETVVHKLDTKYLPEHSWNNLEDKPFGEESISVGDTLTWDGQPTHNYIEYLGMRIYQVSSSTPSKDEWIGATMTVSTASGTVTIDDDKINEMNESVYSVGEVLLVATSDNVPIEVDIGVYITIPKKGIYCTNFGGGYMTSCCIQNYDFKKLIFKSIDPKYLPEGGFGYTEPEKEILPETTLSAGGADFPRLYSVPTDVELGKTYKVTVDGVSITGKTKSSVKKSIKIYYVGNAALFDSDLPDTGEDFVLVKYFKFFGLEADVCFINHRDKQYPDTITASIKLCDHVVQIDPKYLPTDGFGYEEVKHTGGDTLTWDGKSEVIAGEVIYDIGNGQTTIVRTCLVSGKVPTIEELKTGTIIIGSNSYNLSAAADFEYAGVYFLSSADIRVYVALVDGVTIDNCTFPKSGVYFDRYEVDGVAMYISSLHIPNFDFAESEIHKIDTKYIPEVTMENLSTDVKDAMTQKSQVQIITWEADD